MASPTNSQELASLLAILSVSKSASYSCTVLPPVISVSFLQRMMAHLGMSRGGNRMRKIPWKRAWPHFKGPSHLISTFGWGQRSASFCKINYSQEHRYGEPP